MTLESRDEVSEQSDEDEAVLSLQTFTWLLPTPAQVKSQGIREGGGGGGGRWEETISFLLNHKNEMIKGEAPMSPETAPSWRLADLGVVVPADLQQVRLHRREDPLSRQQVLGLAQLAQAEQQSLGQNQEGRALSEAGPSLLLHQEDQLLQLTSRHRNTSPHVHNNLSMT